MRRDAPKFFSPATDHPLNAGLTLAVARPKSSPFPLPSSHPYEFESTDFVVVFLHLPEDSRPKEPTSVQAIVQTLLASQEWLEMGGVRRVAQGGRPHELAAIG
jgi:hypothetical protein